MGNAYITEAFKQFNLLEDTFPVNAEGVEDMQNFLDVAGEDVDDEQVIYDLEAEAEEDLKQSYVGKVILDCNVCHSNVFIDKEEININEDGVANIDTECPYCMSNEGYVVIGEVKPFSEYEEDEDLTQDDLPVEVDEEPIEIEEAYTNRFGKVVYEDGDDEFKEEVDAWINEIMSKLTFEEFEEWVEEFKDRKLGISESFRRRLKESARDDIIDLSDNLDEWGQASLFKALIKWLPEDTLAAFLDDFKRDYDLDESLDKTGTEKLMGSDKIGGVKALNGREKLSGVKSLRGHDLKKELHESYSVSAREDLIELAEYEPESVLEEVISYLSEDDCYSIMCSLDPYYGMDDDELDDDLDESFSRRKKLKESKIPGMDHISDNLFRGAVSGLPLDKTYILNGKKYNGRELAKQFPTDETIRLRKEKNGDFTVTASSLNESLSEVAPDLDRMPIIEFNNGMYYNIDYQDGKLIAGSATNTGIIPEYEIEYDHDDSFDGNLQRLYDEIIEDNPQLLDESYKTRNKQLKENIFSSSSLEGLRTENEENLANYIVNEYDCEFIDLTGSVYGDEYYAMYLKLNANAEQYILPSVEQVFEKTFREYGFDVKEVKVYPDHVVRVTYKDNDLNESIEDVSITTDGETMTMSTKEDGGIVLETSPKEEFTELDIDDDFGGSEEFGSDDEVIAPLEDEDVDELELNSEINGLEDEELEDVGEVEVDEFDEDSFDELGESYLRKVYENVNSFKTTSCSATPTKLMIEGVINFKSGATKKTSFVFEAKTRRKGKCLFEGYNKQISRGKKTFKLNCSLRNKKLVCESLNYNYRSRNELNESVRVNGTIKLTENKDTVITSQDAKAAKTILKTSINPKEIEKAQETLKKYKEQNK